MCGIAGIVGGNASSPDLVARIQKSLSHRGPDDSGSFAFQGCALIHTRLSIVDIEQGQQPMLTPDQRLGITFNGEIYGYQEIAAGLDYAFRTKSDTEVLLALHSRHGVAKMPHVPGMFAFAIWDDDRKQLFCARDRFGEKPFYYAWGDNGEFIFASELKAIFRSGLLTPKLSRSAVAHFLQRLYVPPNASIYENIHCLPPAHSLALRDGKLQIERYWSFPETREMALSDAVEQFRERLGRAVQRQLIADVPVSTFLSGGLDSTTITFLSAQEKPGILAFSYEFEDNSELDFARAAAQQYDVGHVELPEAKHDLAQLLIDLQSVYDEPFADASNLPTYELCKLARQHGKVALTGDGADELLGGYCDWYQPLAAMEDARGHDMPKFLARALLKASRTLHLDSAAKLRGVRMNQTFDSIADAHRAQNQYFTQDDLLSFDLALPDQQASHWTPQNTVNDAMWADTEDYLSGDILVKTDRASMAHGLELRAPFLDVDVAEFCLSLPAAFKVTNTADKILLREAFAPDWPEAIRDRSKHGFGPSISTWLRSERFADLTQSVLLNSQSKLYEIVPHAAARSFAAEQSYRSWALLVLGLWAEEWL